MLSAAKVIGGLEAETLRKSSSLSTLTPQNNFMPGFTELGKREGRETLPWIGGQQQPFTSPEEGKAEGNAERSSPAIRSGHSLARGYCRVSTLREETHDVKLPRTRI